MNLESFPSRDENIDDDLEVMESEVDVEFGPFYLKEIPVVLQDEKIVEFVEDYENDEGSFSSFCTDDVEEYKVRGVDIDFEPADDDCNNGYLKLDKDSINDLIREKKIEFVYNKGYKQYDLMFLEELSDSEKRIVDSEKRDRDTINYLNK